MGKWCVGQVYFMEKWSKRQGLKIAISQKSSYVKFSIIIFSLFLRIIDTQCLYEVHFHTLTVLFAFSFTTCVIVQ